MDLGRYSVAQVAATIDHAVLRPDQTEEDVRAAAVMCIERGVASLCVRPCDVALAAGLLAGSGVMVSCVLSFPHGADTTATKVFQARQAIDAGVEEIDMVMNIGQFLAGHDAVVRDDLSAVVAQAHGAGVGVKVILETGLLPAERIAAACQLAREAGADFVKTSTGFAPVSATPEAVAIMVATVGDTMGVKASGGIRTWEQAVAFLAQGATRLGMGATEGVLLGGRADSAY